MRDLIVIRRKSFTACLTKVSLYVEDTQNGDFDIHGCKCRLLGTLKNGESKTFAIGNESLKLFAIYDEKSKDYCFGEYFIPAGEDKVTVSGVSKFKPSVGNPFVFDSATDYSLHSDNKTLPYRGFSFFKPSRLIILFAGFLALLGGCFFGSGLISMIM